MVTNGDPNEISKFFLTHLDKFDECKDILYNVYTYTYEVQCCDSKSKLQRQPYYIR